MIDSGEGWVDYVDNKGIEFRMAQYVNLPKGWVSVSVNGCTREDPDTLLVISKLMAGNSIAASLKRSDEGKLLNSCAVRLGCTDILTANCEEYIFLLRGSHSCLTNIGGLKRKGTIVS